MFTWLNAESQIFVSMLDIMGFQTNNMCFIKEEDELYDDDEDES